jgi:hypothetical protein
MPRAPPSPNRGAWLPLGEAGQETGGVRQAVSARRLPQLSVGKVNTAPDLIPSGQREVTVLRRV